MARIKPLYAARGKLAGNELAGNEIECRIHNPWEDGKTVSGVFG
jgi:hypothetical protein